MLASELVGRRVSVIAAIADPSPQIAKAATQTIPIVFAINGDPVRTGLVGSLNRPDGNATGITIFGPDAVTKRVQLLHELVPQATAITYVMNPNNPHGDVEMDAARAALRSLGKDMLVVSATARLLQGAKPGDLPVVQSSKLELVVNAQTATMLGLNVPQALLVAADEVIE